MFNLTDPILKKETAQGAARILGAMFETGMDALTVVQEEIAASLESINNGVKDTVDAAFIEKARPVGGAINAIEKPDEVIHGEAI
jgi:transformation/transcription domain-associated protein